MDSNAPHPGQNKTAEVEELLKKGLEAKNKDGKTALLLACEQGNFEKAKELVAKGADINARDNNGRTPLMIACEKGQSDMVIYLLANGADISVIINSSVLTPQFLKQHPELVKYAVDGGIKGDIAPHSTLTLTPDTLSPESARDFLANGGKINDFNDSGQSCLMMAAVKDDPQCMQYLLEKGADVNLQNPAGQTALMTAVDAGCTMATKFLLEHKANPNLQDKEGRTALIYAADKNRTDAAKLLVEFKADITLTDKTGKNALMHAAEKGNLDFIRFLTEDCVEENSNTNAGQKENPDAAKTKETDNNEKNENSSAENTTENPDIENRENKQATAEAKTKEQKESKAPKQAPSSAANDDLSFSFSRPLVYEPKETAFSPMEKGLQISEENSSGRKKYTVAKKIDLNARDNDGNTALMLAAKAGHAKIVAYLLEQNSIDLSIKNNRHQTIFDIVDETKDADLSAILKKIQQRRQSPKFSREEIGQHIETMRQNRGLQKETTSVETKKQNQPLSAEYIIQKSKGYYKN